ncbi:exodeoxyribonuclease V subunit gamma [bacterium]|nr:exodeoxyribonuclease V subunit gamma [bacterium]
MASIQLWTGLPSEERRNRIVETALATSQAGRSVWWLVDTIRRVVRVRENLLSHSSGYFAGITILPTGALARTILEWHGETASEVDADLAHLAMHEVVIEANIEAIGGRDVSRGWTDKLLRIHQRLLSDPSLQDQINRSYPWMLPILNKYKDRLQIAGRYDTFQAPQLALNHLNEAAANLPELLIIDRLGPVNPSTLSLLHKLAECCNNAIVLVDEIQKPGPALALARIEAARWRNHPVVLEEEFQSHEGKEKLVESLFTSHSRPKVSPTDFQVTIRYYTDITAEVKSVAQAIASELHDKLVPDREITVATTNLEEYLPYIEEIFPRFGIQTDLRLGQPLRTNPIARLASQLFRLRATTPQRELITDILLNPYVSWGKAFQNRTAVLEFDSAARDAGIIGRDKNLDESWFSPLQNEITKLNDQAALLKTDSEDDSSNWRAEQYRQRSLSLSAALSDFRSFVEDIYSLPDPCTVSQAAEWLKNLLSKMGVHSRLHKNTTNTIQSARDKEALNKLYLVLEQVSEILQLSGEETWQLVRYHELFERAVNQTRLRPDSRLRGGVQVIGALDIRGLSTGQLYFLGLSSTWFPTKPEDDFLVPFSGSWLDNIDRHAESRSLMLEAIFACKTLHLSVPCPSAGSNQDTPSTFIEELSQAGIQLNEAQNVNLNFHSMMDLQLAVGADLSAQDREKQHRAIRRLSKAKAITKTRQLLGTAAGAVNNLTPWDLAYEGVRVEGMRQNPHILTPYNGLLKNEYLKDAITQNLFDYPLSVTQLKTYAQCPIKFFFRYVLHLEELVEVDDELDAAGLGLLIHNILAKTAYRLQDSTGVSHAFSDNPDRTRQILLKTAEEEIAEYPFENLLWDRVINEILLGLHDLESEEKGYLRQVLDYEVDKLADERIHFAEAIFGMGKIEDTPVIFPDALRVEADDETVEIRGRIDRISFNPAKGWRIWDYKVMGSGLPTKSKVEQGTEFQLPVYTLALEKYLESIDEKPEVDLAAFYQLKGDGISQSGKWNRKNHEEFLPELNNRIVSIARAMKNGYFHQPLSQHGDLCPESKYNFCPFKHICRKNHDLFAEREKHLQQDYLEHAYTLAFQNFNNGGKNK